MNEQILKEEILFIINEIENNPITTQRSLSHKLGMSLGKTNYLLKELIKKGFIEARNFTEYPNKMRKINYILTPHGFEHKVNLMRHFLKIKEKEYVSIKQELDRLALKS